MEFKRFPAKNIEKKKYFYKKEKHLWKKVFLYGNTARQYRGGVIHTYYIKIYFMQEGDKSK